MLYPSLVLLCTWVPNRSDGVWLSVNMAYLPGETAYALSHSWGDDNVSEATVFLDGDGIAVFVSRRFEAALRHLEATSECRITYLVVVGLMDLLVYWYSCETARAAP